MLSNSGFKTSSWLYDRIGLGESTVKALGYLWGIAVIGFMFSAYGYFYELAWWETTIKASVALSLALFIGWWDAFPSNIPYQANIGNIVALAVLYLKI
ncbi:hypothetical protein E2P71_00920 [Candidatus Bathyarchaeota archaeon]|nr:hypothetical protein E2P71_00920 [Candidatus Bathyarchaeota archaeon]